MPSGSRIVLRVAAEADVPTPDADQVAFFADSDAADAPAWKDDGGTVHSLTGADGVLSYQNHNNTGSTETVDASAADIHRLVADAATVTLTLSGAPASGTPALIRLWLEQDGSGGRDWAFPGSVDFGDPGEPDWTARTGGTVDLVDLMTVDGGTTWVATVGGREGPAGANGADGADGAMAKGTSNPGSPSADDMFYRTDLGMIFVYDGTRWLSHQLFKSELRWVATSAGQTFSATVTAGLSAPTPHLLGGSDIWLVTHHIEAFVGGGTALSGSHKWVATFRKYDASDSPTTVVTASLDSGASSVWRPLDTNIGALLNSGTTYHRLATTWTKTGTPGALNVYEELYYRIVAT